MRKSNFELLRIICMVFIIAHHFVVNSGIIPDVNSISTNLLGNYIYLACFGMWGKTAINVFVLITGYFMCRSKLTTARYCKILFVYLFYHYIIYFLLLILHYETVSLTRIYHLLFEVFENANGSGFFTSSFLIFYLFIPFINMFIDRIDKNSVQHLVILLILVFSGLSTIFNNKNLMGESFWFIALYFLGACIRLYPLKWMQNQMKCILYLLISLGLSYSSVVVIILFLSKKGMNNYAYFVSDANKVGAVFVSIFLFCVFKNMNIGYSKVINTIAKTTFGILQIHANSPAVRSLLWKKIFHVDTMFGISFGELVVKSISIVLIIFTVCSIIDFLRIHFIEVKINKVLLKIEMRLNNCLRKIVEKTDSMLSER